MNKQTKVVNSSFWFSVLFLFCVGGALFIESYTVAAFGALAAIVMQLNDIAICLERLLKAQASKGEATDGNQP